QHEDISIAGNETIDKQTAKIVRLKLRSKNLKELSALREFCDKNYNQLLPILAEKMHQEKVQKEKLKAIKARLNFEGTSQHSESGAPSRRMDVRKRLRPKDARNMSKSPEPRRDRSRSPRRKDPERETVFTIWFNREPVG
ncbi:hypothetical protein Tco_1480897, partial [Tanacetum coccineum]